MSVAINGFQYGVHNIPLGQPYAYRVDDCTVNLYSFGGMGLEPSKMHRVTFQFPGETAEKTENIVQQILAHTGPLQVKSFYDEEASCLDIAFTHQVKYQGYLITQDRIYKHNSFMKSEVRQKDGSMVLSEKYEYDDSTNLVDALPCELEPVVKLLKDMQKRIDAFIEIRPHLKDCFSSLSQEIHSILEKQRIDFFDLELLENHCEIFDLQRLFIDNNQEEMWHDFAQYIMFGSNQEDEILKIFSELRE